MRTGQRVSVVIPHLNQPQFLARCLESLARGTCKADEILVVDNGSREMPAAVCAPYPNVRLLHEPTPGPGPARNLGIAESRGDILAFIDADCIAGPDWVAEIERAFADPQQVILGGDVRIAVGNADRPTPLEAYESIYAYRMDRYIAREGFTGTGNLAVRREILERVGPFAGLEVAEDRDWGQRATGMGLKITYLPEMKAYHPARSDFSELARKWDRHSAHDYVTARSKSGGRLRFLVKALAMALSPLAELPRIMASDRITGLRSRFLAMACLARIRLYRSAVMLRLLWTDAPERLSEAWNRR